MPERKTGVFPLNYLTEKDRDIFTDSEIVELMIKTFNYLRTGEEPTFSKRLMKVRFNDHKEFFDKNMESWQKRASNLVQFRDSTESNRIEPNRTESVPNRNQIGYVNVNVNENVNDIKEKYQKKRPTSNIIEHDYSKIRFGDPRKEMK